MAYTHVRFIAYEIPTATLVPKSHDWESGWSAGEEPADVANIPVSTIKGDDQQDAYIRLKRMAHAVEVARKRVATAGDDASTLKVFMMPEFYFRPPCFSDRYVSHTYPDAVAMQILGALNEMFVDDAFTHWLFVCGTVLWNTSGDVDAPLRNMNTAAVVRGGKRPGGSMVLVEKYRPSEVDNMIWEATPGMAKDLKLIYESWSQRKKRVFQVDGITMGLEICLDHWDSPAARVLCNVLADWKYEGETAPPPKIDLHLLTAGGMEISERSVAAQEGGYIFRVDGAVDPNDSIPNSEVRQVIGYFPYEDEEEEIADLNGIHAAACVPMPNVKGVRVPVPAGRLTFTQQIVVYPRLKLP